MPNSISHSILHCVSCQWVKTSQQTLPATESFIKFPRSSMLMRSGSAVTKSIASAPLMDADSFAISTKHCMWSCACVVNLHKTYEPRLYPTLVWILHRVGGRGPSCVLILMVPDTRQNLWPLHVNITDMQSGMLFGRKRTTSFTICNTDSQIVCMTKPTYIYHQVTQATVL